MSRGHFTALNYHRVYLQDRILRRGKAIRRFAHDSRRGLGMNPKPSDYDPGGSSR